MPSLTLVDYWRSGTSHRLRIALNLKGLAYERRHVNLMAGAQHDPAWRAENPQGFVPALIADGRVMTQTLAIMEWLEETAPAPPLLPADPAARAHVRALAGIVACDIHPLGNQRVLKYLREDLGCDQQAAAAFAARWIVDGFTALEALLDGPGPWAAGVAPTMADCCIVPQLYAAQDRYALALPPRLAALDAAAAAHPAFIAAHPKNEPDAPR